MSRTTIHPSASDLSGLPAPTAANVETTLASLNSNCVGLPSRRRSAPATLSCLFLLIASSLMGCAEALRTPIRPTVAQASSITAVNGHRQDVRVSLRVGDSRPVYLATVGALSTESLRLPAWAHNTTVRVLLAVETRSLRRADESAQFSARRPVGAAAPYTVEEINPEAGRRIVLRIAQHLNQSRIVATN